MLHSLQDSGECELLGITISKDNPRASGYTRLVNARYGRPQIPVGVVLGGATPDEGNFIGRFATAPAPSGEPEEAVMLLRRLLAAQPDHSAVIITIGFFTNVARLLDSQPDAASPLCGKELFSRKVKFVCSMAGNFRPEETAGPDVGNPEFNIRTDIPSAQNFIGKCPCPIVFSGFEVGAAVMFPGSVIAETLALEPGHPVAAAYALYLPMPYDRPSWDQTAVLHAVRPQAGYFGLSESGLVAVDPRGFTSFDTKVRGEHRHLILEKNQVPRVREEIIRLCALIPTHEK